MHKIIPPSPEGVENVAKLRSIAFEKSCKYFTILYMYITQGQEEGDRGWVQMVNAMLIVTGGLCHFDHVLLDSNISL